ncbi:hypothetical protein JCM14450A_15070 [Geobacillus stearothermophilus]
MVKGTEEQKGVLSIWYVEVQGEKRDVKSYIIPLSSSLEGSRIPKWEKNIDALFNMPEAESHQVLIDRNSFLKEVFEPMLQRELLYRGIISGQRDYQAKLIGWIEVV